MKEFNVFWPVYKNLEEEVLQLAKYINFSDDQLKVYSMHIADLIVRIVVEIEALSKELYKRNGGPAVFDTSGVERDLYFDTDCLDYLNNEWEICNREIIISCSKFNFSDSYRTIKPLKKANKRGTSSSNWNKAYQAVKHDRHNNLSKGNIENLIYALGALYILNIYYLEEMSEFKVDITSNDSFDNRIGSDVFAASFADASKATFGTDPSDSAIHAEEKAKLDTSLCVIKYTDLSWKNLFSELKAYNDNMIIDIVKNIDCGKLFENNIPASSDEIITKIFSSIETEEPNYMRKNPPRQFGNKLVNAKKEVVLNKGQAIYKVDPQEGETK